MKSQSFKWSLLLALFFWTQMSIAQQIPIQGTVVSDTDKLPIIGASVIEKGTTNGTITDLDGNFSLNVTPGSVILISYVGYLTQELPAKGLPKQIILKEDAKALSEIVVTGYSTQKKADLTGCSCCKNG